MKARQNKIYDILRIRGSATVEQLVQEVYASEATVRRDLDKMEREGLLTRVWGGAVAADKINCDPPAFVRSVTNINSKKKIARKAMSFLSNNMSIFLPSGTTVMELVKLFNMFENLTVITTGHEIINTLVNYSSVKVISPGGELYENYDYVSPFASNNIEKFNADVLFFSCSGITADGFTFTDANRMDIIQKMQKNSSKTILLADTSKIGNICTYKGLGFDCIDYVVMEKLPDNKEFIKALGKKLVVTK